MLDLRLNPGGKLDQAISVSDDFIPEGEIVSIRGRHAENNRRWDAKGTDITGKLPIVVLIDGGSASRRKSSPVRCRIIVAPCFWARNPSARARCSLSFPFPAMAPYV